MNEAQTHHGTAMDLADQALFMRKRGDNAKAAEFFQAALASELQAIGDLEHAAVLVQPTYSILLRSGATLALDCGDHELAERLVAKAIISGPPPEIAEELRDLIEQVYFVRHLRLRGVTLGEDSLQMNLTGRGVGFGVVQSDDFVQRIDTASKAFYRIAERRNKRPFREKGPPTRCVRGDYEIFVEAPRAACFAVTLKLGQPSDQEHLPGMLDTSKVIDEFMELLDLISASKWAEVDERIPEPDYRRNFIGLAKKLAPDGSNVRQVGFTVVRGGEPRSVSITRPRREFPQDAEAPSGGAGQITVRGSLRFADDIGKATIKVVPGNHSTPVAIKVPGGMMADIVRPLWGLNVIVRATKRTKGSPVLVDIQQDDESQGESSSPSET